MFYPPSQKATGVNPWMNARGGTLRSLGEGGYASEGSALRRVWIGATAVRPWGSTVKQASGLVRDGAALPGRPNQLKLCFCTKVGQLVCMQLPVLPIEGLNHNFLGLGLEAANVDVVAIGIRAGSVK